MKLHLLASLLILGSSDEKLKSVRTVKKFQMYRDLNCVE